MANPCAAKVKQIRKYPMKNMDKVLELGEKLWNDPNLGGAGISCATCHPGGKGLKNEPFPRYIKMADDILTLDQMINFCMINPMKGERLSWNHQKMTALAAYVKAHTGEEAHPCAVKHPCAAQPCAKHPCGAQPCAKHPCGMKHPCGK